MAGGGTGGHVIPSLAVARVLSERGHRTLFVGTKQGIEARLVPAAGLPIEYIEIGGIKGEGWDKRAKTLGQIPAAITKVIRLFERERPSAVFSMGGYVAGPVMLAAILRRIPLVVMEPNALPGVANRYVGRLVSRALLSFEEARRWFPASRSEITGLPVRPEFFELAPKPPEEKVTVLITGGSQGSRTLNNAAVQSWPLFRAGAIPVRLLHQTGSNAYPEIAPQFEASGVDGEVKPFIADMPSAFAQADVIVCRAGAGAVGEVAAAGKAAILVPFPYAADQHQLRNAEALVKRRAARLVLDSEMNGRRLFDEVMRGGFQELGARAREFAKPGAVERAADVLEELSTRRT